MKGQVGRRKLAVYLRRRLTSKRPSFSLDSWIATHKAMSHMKSKLDLNSYFFKIRFLDFILPRTKKRFS